MSTDIVSARPTRAVPLLGLGAVVVALVALYFPTFRSLANVWESDPNYSHGWLVLPLSLWLAWRAWQNVGPPQEGEAQPGLGVMLTLTGVLVHLGAVVVNWPLLDFVGLVLILRGCAVTAGGQRWAGHFTFPALFLFFLFPLPHAVTSWLALYLQSWVSVISSGVLNLFFVCQREGTNLRLAGLRQPLIVAEACSGLRQLIAFLALAALMGHLTGRPWPFRLALLLAALPVAVLANVLRVLLMAFGAYYFGTDWMNSWLHDAPAAFSLPVGLVLFFLIVWGLGRLWPAPQSKEAPACP